MLQKLNESFFRLNWVIEQAQYSLLNSFLILFNSIKKNYLPIISIHQKIAAHYEFYFHIFDSYSCFRWKNFESFLIGERLLIFLSIKPCISFISKKGIDQLQWNLKSFDGQPHFADSTPKTPTKSCLATARQSLYFTSQWSTEPWPKTEAPQRRKPIHSSSFWWEISTCWIEVCPSSFTPRSSFSASGLK